MTRFHDSEFIASRIITGADIYLDYDHYSRVVTALADLQPCPFAGRITEDQIKRTLGAASDIWPREIQAAVILANLEDAEKRRAAS